MRQSSPECNGSILISGPLSVLRCKADLIVLINVNREYLLHMFAWQSCTVLLFISFLNHYVPTVFTAKNCHEHYSFHIFCYNHPHAIRNKFPLQCCAQICDMNSLKILQCRIVLRGLNYV